MSNFLKLAFILCFSFTLFSCSTDKNEVKNITEVESHEVTSSKIEEASTDESQTSEVASDFNEETNEKKLAEESQTEEPSKKEVAKEEKSITTVDLIISCETAHANIDKLAEEKRVLITQNSIIYQSTVEFTEGESVFDILLRETKSKKIHLEFVSTFDGSVYIEGINNLYEMDMGELSGWMYSVNSSFPNYSSSKYIVKHGDKINWSYTCDLGKDLGRNLD